MGDVRAGDGEDDEGGEDGGVIDDGGIIDDGRIVEDGEVGEREVRVAVCSWLCWKLSTGVSDQGYLGG